MKKNLLISSSLLVFSLGSFAYSKAEAQHFARLDRFVQTSEQQSGKPAMVALPRLLKQVAKRYQVEFNYNYRQLNQKMVDMSVLDQKHDKIETILTEVLNPLELTFEKLNDRSYLIYPKPSIKPASRESSGSGQASANLENTTLQASAITQAQQDNTITGVVKDEQGRELPGVSVVIKGTTRGTSTDKAGAFSLAVPDGRAVLVFSFVGYLKKEITVGNQTLINIALAPDDQSLDEVIVVGYGTQKKANMTGAVSTVDSKDIENRPVANVALALQGLSPGLSITRTTGQPGDDDGIGIQIRGASSANGNVPPLLIVDGVSNPGVTLMSLNPNDIETISVLKDAAAAAIYGAQAAGGVILVTTKKGKQGKTIFEFSSIAGIDWALNVPERLPTWEELTFNNMARLNSGAAAGYSDETIQILKEGKITYRINPNDTTRYQYFGNESIVDQMLRKNTYMQTYNMSARGGTDKLNYLISFGYYDKQGVFEVGPDKNDRFNVRFNLGTQLTKHLSLDSRITYTLQRQEASVAGLNGNGALLFNIYRYSSSTPLLTPEGRYAAGQGATAYALMDAGGYNNYNRNFFDGVFTARLSNLAKGLEIRAIYGAQYRRGDRDIFKRAVERWYRTTVAEVLNTPNGYTVSKDLTLNNNLQFLADYDFSIGPKHRFHVLGGYQWEASRLESVSTGVTAMSSNDLPSLSLGDENSKTNSQNVSTYAFQSYFGRFNYNFADKYLFEATFRVDESSKLAPDLRQKAFPSVSAGWNMHREPWFSVPVISEFKLRGSWGTLGAASGIGYYDYLALLNRGAALVLGSPEVKSTYFGQTVVPSSQLSWETIETSDVGLDFGLFKNKIQASFDYYVKFNRNMLTALQLPATFGVGTPRINNGELKSWGWETELKYRDRIGKDFTFSVGLNVSDNQNKLINFAGRRVIAAGTVGTLEGYPLNSIWGYQTAGYFQSADDVKNWAFQDSRTAAGDIKYVDLNGDQKINVGSGSAEDHGDLIYLGTTQPRFLFGFNLSMQWKGFDFSAFFQGVGKRNFLPTRQALDPFIASFYQPLAIHRDFWTPDNQNAFWPRPYTNATHNYLTADRWVQNGQYIRLKNVQVGYSIPKTLLSKVKMSSARIYFTGQDLLTFSGLGIFKGYFDPEQRDGVAADYPFFATAAMGLNISF